MDKLLKKNYKLSFQVKSMVKITENDDFFHVLRNHIYINSARLEFNFCIPQGLWVFQSVSLRQLINANSCAINLDFKILRDQRFFQYQVDYKAQVFPLLQV